MKNWILIILAFVSAVTAQVVPSQMRSVTSLPLTCNDGTNGKPMDMVALVSGGITTPYYCKTMNNWFPSVGTSITLQTNGVPNTVQSTLNLIPGTNMTLTPNGAGGVTFAAAGNISNQGALTPGHLAQIFDATHISDLNVTGSGLGVLQTGSILLGTTSIAGLKLTGITGLTQCLHVDTLGNVSGTALDCGSGGGGGVLGTNKQFFINNAGTGAGSGVVAGGQIVTQMTYDVVSGKTSIPNLASIRFADSYAWSQLPAADLTSAGAKTVTLTPCPLGIDVSNNVNAPYKVYVSTTGTPEVVAITGGTCTGGATSGTITFTTVNTHANGYTVSSTTLGTQEAVNDACAGSGVGGNCQVQMSPSSSGSPNYTFYSTLYLRGNTAGGGIKIHLIGNGAYVNCATRDVCIFNGNRATSAKSVYNVIQGIRFKTDSVVDGVQITGVSAAGGTYTVTAPGHPFVTGDYISSEWYSPNGSQHTVRQITVTDSSHYTYTLGSATFSNTAPTWGWAALEHAAIEDDAQGSVLRDIDFAGTTSAGGTGNGFDYGIIIDNNQNANLQHITNSTGGLRCTANFCGAYVWARGDLGANGIPNAAIVHLSDSDFTLPCAGNGILGQSGNSLAVSNVVVQGFNQYAITYLGGLQEALVSNLYTEIGSCANPQYPGSLQVAAGLLGQQFTVKGSSPIVGINPLYANTGANRRNYFFVPKSSGFGVGPIMFAGYAMTNNAGTVNVYWPQAVNDSSAGAITYDVLLTTGITNPAPYLANANSLATGISGSCANGICTFADTHAATSAYTVLNQTWYPHLYFWPGSYAGVDSNNSDASSGVSLQFNMDRFVTTGNSGYVSTHGIKIPSLIANVCTPSQSTLSPAWTICQGSLTGGATSQGTVYQQVGATVAPPANIKGRLNLGTGILNFPLDLVTLMDSNTAKTFATANNRPLADANDAAWSADQTGGIASRAATSVSQYIGSLADNSSWLTRLTAAGFTSKVPWTVNDGSGAFNLRSTFGNCTPPGDATHDTMCFDPIGDLAFNKKNTTNFRKVIPQDYTFATTLPAANSVDPGQLAVITDASTSACPVTSGGGSIRVLVRSNGTTWDCVSGPGSAAISVGLFSNLPGSPANNQLAIVTDWTGLCPVTSGNGSTLHEHMVIWNSGTSKWDCVPDGLLPYITTVQAFDGAGNGGLHFIAAGTASNTSDQLDLHLNSTGNLLEFADGSGPPGLLYSLGMWAIGGSIPAAGNQKCLDVDSAGHIVFETVRCFQNPITSTGDLIVGTGGVNVGRLGIGANGTAPVSNGTTLAYQAVLANPMTTPEDMIKGGTAGAPVRVAIGTNGQTWQVVAGVAQWGSSGAGTVNPGTACNPAYYATSAAAISGFPNICLGDGTATAWMKINPATASQDIFNVSLNSTNKFWVDSTGLANIASTGIKFQNSTSGTTTLIPGTTGTNTVTLPATTDTLVGKATTDTLTNKTYDVAGTGNAFKINSTTVTSTYSAANGIVAGNNSAGTYTSHFSGAAPFVVNLTAQTAAIGTTTFCLAADCPAGQYHYDIYTFESGGTGCTTPGASSVRPVLTYSDGITHTAAGGGGFRENGTSAAGLAPSTTGTNFHSASGTLYTNGSATIQIATTFTACTTPGSWTGYSLRAVIYPVQ